MTTITTYNGTKADFYIQAKGLHAGRPLENPIPNCFAVNTDVENAFEIVYALYISGVFKNYILGSVIPFIRISSIRDIIAPAFDRAYNKTKLNAVSLIDAKLENLKKQMELMEQMKISIARELIKK